MDMFSLVQEIWVGQDGEACITEENGCRSNKEDRAMFKISFAFACRQHKFSYILHNVIATRLPPQVNLSGSSFPIVRSLWCKNNTQVVICFLQKLLTLGTPYNFSWCVQQVTCLTLSYTSMKIEL